MKVLAVPEVIEYLKYLTTILYEKGNFGNEEYAQGYVNALINDINATLSIRPSKPAPINFEKYGKELKYTSFRKNRQTTWYVFFEVYQENGEIIYLIKHVENNHPAAQYFNF